MKQILSIIDKGKAYFILLVSGWRSIEIFGTPKDTMGTYIVCLKNNAVMEFNYSNFDGDVRWWKIGIGDEHSDNPIIFWKLLPKSPYACH
ncbi:MAG: hypothetical protein COS19_02270 [Flavobacteriaceae bacterium CG02_land_8_20_14_3_00_34_13]|nr:hypothetical protein [Flavobacteriia bacterium]PIV51145.1 MAG: hypothetical protein COS19_02270 [Flavobacteriaceae bacterium CG02_land_8_20_14_3_00_34_13]PJC08266.1 MAG: hypothetical protein CO068_01835 [Flavobacteriaceae bacterium CG_4_9_14_0_8_um_filter_34_30]